MDAIKDAITDVHSAYVNCHASKAGKVVMLTFDSPEQASSFMKAMEKCARYCKELSEPDEYDSSDLPQHKPNDTGGGRRVIRDSKTH